MAPLCPDVMLCRMQSPNEPVTLPLDYATELAMELHLMRAECSDAAQAIMEESSIDEVGLEECAVLDEALVKAQAVLHSAIGAIRKLRESRNS